MDKLLRHADEYQITDTSSEQIGKNISKFRKQIGFPQSAMATILGISERQYQRYEAGKSTLKIFDLIAIRDIFEVELGEKISLDKLIN